VFDPLHIGGKKVAVFGLGNTGLSLARYAERRGANVRVLDSRSEPPQLAMLREEVPNAQFFGRAFDASQVTDVDHLFVSPGVSVYEPVIQAAIARGVACSGDIEVFAHHIPSSTNTLGITGSNGKTTTTALTGALCAAAGLATLVAGNIGATVLDELTRIEASASWPDAIVLELSSFQMEATRSLRCAAASILNLSEDHSDRYPSYFDYAAAKAPLFSQTALQVFNRDDPFVRAMRRPAVASLSFGTSSPTTKNFGLTQGWLARGEERLIETKAMQLVGQHNHLNALAALALVSSIASIDQSVLNALKNFKGLAHRMALIATVDGVSYVDDSKATNVGAVVSALQGLTQPCVLIAGGDGKGQDFTPLNEAVKNKARAVVLIGRDASALEVALSGSGVSVVRCDTLPDAVRSARAYARSGDMVLLSPACASLDMFKNYAHRSEVFAQAVEALRD
jgi:UDP-N-acetylmuramoylalanine--D-glutamate ligase